MKRALFLLLWITAPAWAVRPDLKTLPIGLAPSEMGRAALAPSRPTAPPVGTIRSLGEWEEARAVMTLWTNPSLVRELAKRGKVMLLADSESNKTWWGNWLKTNHIPAANVSYFIVPTNSIWIRDYGPWPILDGDGHYGFVHNTYNRPRPIDNQVAGRLAAGLGVPFFDTGLTHTGGNYYSDGVGNGFSSTLVFSENSSLGKDDVLDRMKEFLGIESYTTSRLNPGITIEHLDTYGKLVTPDTWVFSDFPAGSRYRADSEAMVKLLSTLKSPYGTPYKIHRMKMWPGGGQEFRAYLNSFISNGALYFPTYGNDAIDAEAKRVYQAALPNYEIVGIENGGTGWGDSVHCRNRNLIEWNTSFLFPKVEHTATSAGETTDVAVDVFPTPGSTLAGTPEIVYTVDGGSPNRVPMSAEGGTRYVGHIGGVHTGARLALHIEASDTARGLKRAPARAEIELVVAR